MRNTVHAPGITTATFATEAETSKQPLKRLYAFELHVSG